MDIEAVLVSLKLKHNQTSNEVSGTLYNNFIIVPGTVLIPLLGVPQERNWLVSFVKSISSTLEQNENLNKIQFRVFRDVKNTIETNKVSEAKLIPQESVVVGVWKCALVSHSLENLFYDWTLGHVNKNYSTDQSSNDIDTSKELMSIFIILKYKDTGELEGSEKKERSNDEIQALFNLWSSLIEPFRGQEIEVVSTPFGNRLFFNSLSHGIISNVTGQEKCLILTDARTVTGCEGGPIFATKNFSNENHQTNLIGLVTCSLSWWRGEWVGLTIGISLMPVIRCLLLLKPNFVNANHFYSTQFASKDSLDLSMVDDTVILIQNDSSWGSGVVVDATSGTIITCSHVVKNARNINIFYRKQYYPAVVIFKTQNDLAYDLAILKVDHFVFKFEIEMSTKPAKIGEAVIAVGFPFFSEKDDYNICPSLARGCVSKVTPFMIQTTCCIQSGFSGGALLRDGKLLGIIISNAKDTTAGALFPHINFVIPSSVFREPVIQYLKTNDLEFLKILECSDSQVQSLWALQISKL